MDPNNPFSALSRAETIEPYTPTARQRLGGGLESLLAMTGMPGFQARQASEAVIGTPTGMGMADFSPLGMIFGGEEGYRAARAGVRTGDPAMAAMGAGEALLSVVPGVGRAADPLIGMVSRGSKRAPGASNADRQLSRLQNQLSAARKRALEARAAASAPGQSRLEMIRKTAEARRLEAELAEIESALAAARAAPPEPTEAARLAAAETSGRVTQARLTRRERAAADAARAAGWDRGEFRTVRHQVGWEGVKPTKPKETGTLDLQTGRARRQTETAAGAPGRKAVFMDFLEVPASTALRLGLERFNFRDSGSRISPDGKVFYLAPEDRDGFLRAWEATASRPGGIGSLPKTPTVKPAILDSNLSLDTYEALFEPRAGLQPKTWQQVRQEAMEATRRKPEGEK